MAAIAREKSVISLSEARKFTGLDLISAREIDSTLGQTYHELEGNSESKSHQSAREQGISFFCSLGYKVFPEGVGVVGTYTLADFVAVRKHRTVFVEVLSDTNIKTEVLQRKALLQEHGELCFILFSGTKRSDKADLLASKQLIESWADVLYCRLDGFGGNRIERTYKATVAYDTTRDRGIRVALTFEQSGRKLLVSTNFITHLFQNPSRTPIAYTVLPRSYCYEEIFLEVFQAFASQTGQRISFTSRKRHVTAIRAMRRKSGLKSIGDDGCVASRLRSEYRGPPVDEVYMWTYHPSSRDLPPEHIYGVFVLEDTGPDGLITLLSIMKEYGLQLEYNASDLEQGLESLRRQRI